MTRDELAAAGFDLDPAHHALLTRFVRCLMEENQRLNLTAAGSDAEVWRIHVCDSLALLPAVRSLPAARVLDLGSGGGLPGLPLACVCESAHVTLVDATRKKVAALERIIARLGLTNARAVWGRAETLAHDPACREQFNIVTARAVAALAALVEYAAGFVRVGGSCLFFKSAAGADAERASAESAACICGLAYAGTRTYRLPDESESRALVEYRKVHLLDASLPRAAGRARKRPL